MGKQKAKLNSNPKTITFQISTIINKKPSLSINDPSHGMNQASNQTEETLNGGLSGTEIWMMSLFTSHTCQSRLNVWTRHS